MYLGSENLEETSRTRIRSPQGEGGLEHGRNGRLLQLLILTISLGSFACAALAQEQFALQSQVFEIEAESTRTALLQVAEQSETNIVFAHGTGDDSNASSISGRMTLDEALSEVLAGTDLMYKLVDPNLIVIRRSEKTADAVHRVGSSGDNRDGLDDLDNPLIEVTVIEEVFVTVRRRRENLQLVPFAMTVLPSPVLADANVIALDETVDLVSSLTYSGGVEPRNTSVRLRGIGTQSFSLAAEPSVSLLLDGIVTGRPGLAAEDIVDVERIEVLRGPQGTLFGKNASAGLINIITRGPDTDHLGGYVKLGIAEQNENSIHSAVTGPLSPRWAFRVNGFYRDWDGIAKNLNTGKTVGGVDSSWGGRGKLQYRNAGVRALLTVDYSETDSECCVRAGRSVLGENTFLHRAGTPIGGENVDVNEDAAVFSSSKNASTSLQFGMPVGGNKEISYLGGYREWQNSANLDNDSTRFNFVPQQGGVTNSRVVSQELRIASPQAADLSYVLGLYAFHHEADRQFTDVGCTLEELDETEFDFVSGEVFGCSLASGTLGSGNFSASIKNTNIAAFSHLNWRIMDQTSLLGGFRVLRETLEFEFIRENPPTGNLNGALPGRFTASDDTSANHLLWLAGVQHQFSNDVMGYGTVSTGYKGKAYSISQPLDSETLAREPLDAEESVNVEFGLKGTFLNGRLILNTAVFHTEIEDLQIQARNPGTDDVIFRNAASVQTQGIEFDLTVRVQQSFSIVGGLILLDARFLSFDQGLCYPGQSPAMGCNDGEQNLSGAPFINAPDTKLTVSAKYDFEVGNSNAFIQTNYAWQDKTLYSLNQDPNRIQEAYGILSAEMGFQSRNGRLEFMVYGKNLTDRFHVNDIIQNVSTVMAQSGYYHTFARDVRRYFGATLAINF